LCSASARPGRFVAYRRTDLLLQFSRQFCHAVFFARVFGALLKHLLDGVSTSLKIAINTYSPAIHCFHKSPLLGQFYDRGERLWEAGVRTCNAEMSGPPHTEKAS
jgi:hypothetical protein